MTITLDKRTWLSSIVANSSGAFCKTVRLPARVLGAHAIRANDGHGRVAGAQIRIVRPGVRVAGVSLTAETTTSGAPTGGALAFTGAAVIGTGALGGLLLIGGGLMLFTGTRRKTIS